jgi:hypothetical protein
MDCKYERRIQKVFGMSGGKVLQPKLPACTLEGTQEGLQQELTYLAKFKLPMIMIALYIFLRVIDEVYYTLLP